MPHAEVCKFSGFAQSTKWLASSLSYHRKSPAGLENVTLPQLGSFFTNLSTPVYHSFHFDYISLAEAGSPTSCKNSLP